MKLPKAKIVIFTGQFRVNDPICKHVICNSSVLTHTVTNDYPPKSQRNREFIFLLEEERIAHQVALAHQLDLVVEMNGTEIPSHCTWRGNGILLES